MLKESITCIIIVITIFIFDNRTQAYTQQSVESTTNRLESLRDELLKHEKQNTQIDINEIYNQWMEFHNKLAFYIEHDELEKVETEMVGLKGNIEVEEYEIAVSKLDKCIFILQHIADKYKFSIDNIF